MHVLPLTFLTGSFPPPPRCQSAEVKHNHLGWNGRNVWTSARALLRMRESFGLKLTDLTIRSWCSISGINSDNNADQELLEGGTIFCWLYCMSFEMIIILSITRLSYIFSIFSFIFSHYTSPPGCGRGLFLTFYRGRPLCLPSK